MAPHPHTLSICRPAARPAPPGRRLALLGTVAGAGLLGVFGVVVAGAVHDAEAARRAQAAWADAAWRCNALRPRAQRDACWCRFLLAQPAGSRTPAGLARAASPAAAGTLVCTA